MRACRMIRRVEEETPRLRGFAYPCLSHLCEALITDLHEIKKIASIPYDSVFNPIVGYLVQVFHTRASGQPKLREWI